mgnify:FL=1
MILSRNWLNEFVDLKDITDKQFNDDMTLSGSKVETIERPDENLKNVVVGKILEMKRHENSDHMWVLKIDVGQAEPVQIVTGAWNIHVGDYVPAALHGAHLPGGVKIEKGKLRGVESEGMLCSLKELGMTAEHDFPYAVITPAALLNDYHPIDPAKPSIPADIKPGDKVYGPVVAARVLECAPLGDGTFHTCLDLGNATAVPDTRCSNLHEGDLVAYNTKSGTICTLEDLHAEQKEFPHCIADGIFVLQEEDAEPGLNMARVLGFDDSIVEFEITPNRPDCLSVIGLAREASATNLNAIENAKAAQKHREDVERAKAEETRKALSGKAIKIVARGAEGGRLYGSVTAQEIADELFKQYGVKVEKRRIDVANIRNAGDFTVSVWLHAGITAEMTAKVEVG